MPGSDEARRRQRRALWILFAFAVLVLSTPVIIWLVVDHIARRNFDAEIAKLRAAGEKVDYTDWAPRPIAESEDSTPLLREAFHAYEAA